LFCCSCLGQHVFFSLSLRMCAKRSTSSVHGMGPEAECRPLSRSRQCCSWPHAISNRVSAPRPCQKNWRLSARCTITYPPAMRRARLGSGLMKIIAGRVGSILRDRSPSSGSSSEKVGRHGRMKSATKTIMEPVRLKHQARHEPRHLTYRHVASGVRVPLNVRADAAEKEDKQIATQFIFGFTAGTDVGELGEKEIEQTIGMLRITPGTNEAAVYQTTLSRRRRSCQSSQYPWSTAPGSASPTPGLVSSQIHLWVE